MRVVTLSDRSMLRTDWTATAAKVAVTVTFDGTKLTFQHDGPPFRDDEIAHLIFHGSTKQNEHAGIGRFGTGFISTHLLSRVVRVSGPLDDGYVFDFELDRTGQDATGLEASMGRSWDAMNTSLKPSGSQDKDRLTTFVYPIDGETESVVTTGLEGLSRVAPLILAFNGQFISLAIEVNGWSKVYRVQSQEHLGDTLQRLQVVDESGTDAGSVLVAVRDDVQVAIVIAVGHQVRSMLPTPGTSRVYVAFPLSSTAHYPVRAAINSDKFHPRTERDGIYLDSDDSPKNIENRARFEAACDLFGPLVEHVAEDGLCSVTDLLVLNEPVGLESVNGEYLRRVIRERVVQDVASRPVLLTRDRLLITPQDAVIPFAEAGKRGPLWRSIAAFKSIGPSLPSERDVDGWNEVVVSWSQFTGQPPESTDSVWLVENLIAHVAECQTVTALKDALDVDPWTWLSDLLDLLKLDGKLSLISNNAILPNQRGEFKNELLLDDGIPAELKDIAEELGLEDRSQLLARELSNCCYANELDTQTRHDLFEAILGAIGAVDESNCAAVVRLFAFAVQNKHRSWLDRIPVCVVKIIDGDFTISEQDP